MPATLPPSSLLWDRHPPQRRQAAFTITELLVVITIIVSVMAFTLGGLFGHKDTNRILATEQLVADMVRQARHAARSSGEPVELRISQMAASNGMIIGGRIAGVSRTPVWSQSFDDPANIGTLTPSFGPLTNPGVEDPDPSTGLTLGRTGNGVWPMVLSQSTIPASTRQAMLQHQLLTSQFLVRGSDPNGAADGFFLACAVRPPSAYATWQSITPAPTRSTPLEMPRVLIGGAAAQGLASTCIAGLKLVLNQYTLTQGGSPHPLYCWQLCGWVNQPGSPAVTTTITSLDGVDQQFGPPNPICGERWEDIGMLYDGAHLSLYRNGVALLPAVGSPAISTSLPSANLLVAPANETVFIGQLLQAGATATEYADAPVDDVRILRLAADQSQDLPPTVVPETHGTLLFRPDGTMIFTPDAVASSQPALVLANPVPGNPTVLPTGSVSLTMPQGTLAVTPVQSAGTASSPTQTLVFCRHTNGLRDGGAGNAAVIIVPVNGPVISALGTVGRDASTGTTSYVVYNQPISGP